MSPLFFETEDALRQATQHLDRPGERRTRRASVRRHNRWPITCEFTLLSEVETPAGGDDDDEEPVCLTSLDLSPSGVFLKAPNPGFELGQGLLMEFISPVSHRPVRVWGRVTRVVPSQMGERPGMGIEFFDISDAQRSELALLNHTTTVSSAYAH
ncbi:MAG: PilZ domain-containing protein [Myxococcota bacterium]